jgi:hypothetical protein
MVINPTPKMAEIESQSELSSHRARRFFVPSAAELVLYVVLSLVLVLVLNAGSIISKLSNNYIGEPQHLKANFSTFFDGFSNSFSSALGGRLGQILLWSFVGAITYIAIWLLKNVLNSFENDIIAAHYMHPAAYDRIGYWGSSFAVKIFLGATLIVTAAYFFIILTAILPSLAALAGSAAYQVRPSVSPLYIGFVVLMMALALYLAVLLTKLVSHLWKLL